MTTTAIVVPVSVRILRRTSTTVAHVERLANKAKAAVVVLASAYKQTTKTVVLAVASAKAGPNAAVGGAWTYKAAQSTVDLARTPANLVRSAITENVFSHGPPRGPVWSLAVLSWVTL